MSTVGRTLLANLFIGVVLVGLVELVYSGLAWIFFSPTDVWIFENVGRTVRFDAVRGYELTRTPSRFARITRGTVVYVGAFQGNAQGMPDRDDFSVERPPRTSRRYAVFGDSYTSAQYIARNWPDRTEDLLHDVDLVIELLNFSTHGGGLANWVRNLNGILAKDNYEVDGLIFAENGDDLERMFTVADGRDRDRFAFGRVAGWNAASYPKTYEDARDLLDGHEIKSAYILSRAEFESALADDWKPTRFWEFKVATAAAFHLPRLWRAVQRHISAWSDAGARKSRFSPGQLRQIDAIKDYAGHRNIPVKVIHVPGLNQVAHEPDVLHEQAEEFAQRLNAEFIDGRKAFDGVERDELYHFWFRNDEHWNQAGSDAFAAFMAEQLKHP
jgi:hypothetical protein